MFKRVALLSGLLVAVFVIAQQNANEPASTTGENSAPQRTVFNLGPGIRAPKPISTRDPEYPANLRKAGVQGTCIIDLVVDEDGRTTDVHVTRSPDKRLDGYAIDAVKQWKFTPATKDGKPVKVRMKVEVSFRLYPK